MDDLHRMLDLVKDPNPQIRKYALAQVEELADGVDDEDVLEVLREAARDSVPLVSHQAIRSLARLLGRAFLSGRHAPHAGPGDSNQFEGVPLAELRSTGYELLERSVKRLSELVRSPDKRGARRALVALGKIAAPGSAEVVASVLADPTLAGAAAIALPGIGGEEAMRPLLKCCLDPAAPGRLHAVLELGRFSEREPREALMKLAGDENAAIRANAAMALGELKPGADTREVLGRLLGDAEVWVTVYAIRSLARDESLEAARLVATAYHKVEDPHVQASCVAVLGGMGKVARQAAEGVLTSAITHPDDRVRANAVEAVARLIEERDLLVRMIAPLSTDPNNRVLGNLAVGLAPHDPPAAIEILERLASVDDKWFRTSAAWAAGAMDRREAFPVLTRLSQSGDATILMMVVRSLESFPADDALPLLARLASSSDSIVRARAAEGLGRVGGDAVCQALASRFQQEPDPVTRAALVNAIAMTRAAGTTTALLAALNDNHNRVQANAVEALGKVGSLDVLSVVRPFARGANTRLRANAWIALWRLGDLEMAEEAATALAAPPDPGLFSAIYAVGEMGRELRQLGSQSSNLMLLAALKEKGRSGGLSISQAALSVSHLARPASEPESHLDPELAIERVLELLLSAGIREVEAEIRKLPPGVPAGVGAYLLSRARLAARDQAGALQLLEECCAAGCKCLSPHLDLANYYLRNRRDKEAAERFLHAFAVRRDALATLDEAAKASLEKGDLTVVSRILKFLFGQGPMAADTHARVGREFLAIGDSERAFRHLLLARIEFPREPNVATDYAFCALRMGRRSLAKKVTEFAKRAAGADARLLGRIATLDSALAKGRV